MLIFYLHCNSSLRISGITNLCSNDRNIKFIFNATTQHFRHSILQAPANERNMLMQQIATLMGAACCARLAILLRRAATFWVLQIELVGNAWRSIAAQTWPNKHHQA